MATRYPHGTSGTSGEPALTAPTASTITRATGGVGTVTGASLDIVTGLATIIGYSACLAEDPGAGVGDVFQVSATKHATPGTLTVWIWQDDATAATEDTDISWTAVGT